MTDAAAPRIVVHLDGPSGPVEVPAVLAAAELIEQAAERVRDAQQDLDGVTYLVTAVDLGVGS